MSTMGNRSVLVLSTLVLAFCSIVYELVLGQALSAFMGNTVLRYSVTIGLYLFSMGIGAYWAEESSVEHARSALVKVEIALSLIGGGLLFLLHGVHVLVGIGFIFSFFAHSLIVVVGVLTGFELPFLMLLWGKKESSEGIPVLALNYLGALMGPLTFALYFFPTAGLVWTCAFVGWLNALAGTMFLVAWRKDDGVVTIWGWLLPLLVVFYSGIMLNEQVVTEYLQGVYLSR